MKWNPASWNNFKKIDFDISSSKNFWITSCLFYDNDGRIDVYCFVQKLFALKCKSSVYGRLKKKYNLLCPTGSAFPRFYFFLPLPLAFTALYLSIVNFRLRSTANSHSAYRKISRNCRPFLNSYILFLSTVSPVMQFPFCKRPTVLLPTDSDSDITSLIYNKTHRNNSKCTWRFYLLDFFKPNLIFQKNILHVLIEVLLLMSLL